MYKIHLHKLGLELVETERAVAPAILLLSLALSGPEESEKKKKKNKKRREDFPKGFKFLRVTGECLHTQWYLH